MTQSGTVKWFSRVKGYGFINPDDGGKEVFAHYSAIVGEGYRNLYEGERVEYELVDKGKGPQAKNITRGWDGVERVESYFCNQGMNSNEATDFN